MQARTGLGVDESSALVKVDGRLDFARRKEFTALCEKSLAVPDVAVITIDLSRVTYIDSAALGLLLIVKDKAMALKKSVRLQGAAGMVAETLKIAKFDALFAGDATFRVQDDR